MNDALEGARRLLGDRFEHLAGARVSGELPITEPVINRAIAEQLAGASGPVAGVHVRAHDGDALAIDLALRGVPMISAVPVTARIDQQPRMPDAPVLGLQWSLAGLGALARIAAPFVAKIRTLPPGIRIDGDRVLLDIGELLRRQGLGEFLRYVSHLEVHAQEGRIVVRFELAA